MTTEEKVAVVGTGMTRRSRYRHSAETRAKMSLRSGRRRAVFVGDVRYASLQDAAKAEKISYASFQMRLNRGWDGYRYDVG